jgi:hypothetical protein
MDSKENLIQNIREWVNLDNEMRTLKDELNKRKKRKDEISSELIKLMKQNNIDSVDINNGQIEYSKKNVKKPITKKMLLNILAEFYKGDDEKAQELNTYIMEHREEVVKESIVRKMKGNND